ncbi:MAG: hypothetical protein V1694_07445 [Candidatus Eisenbacteria bacterium]
MSSRDKQDRDEGNRSSDASSGRPAPRTGPEGACSCGPSSSGPSSCGPDCCGPQADSGGSPCGWRGVFRFRSIIFIVVIAAAIAVAAWSLIRANRKAAEVPIETDRAVAVATSPGLADLAPEKDFAFVLLAGADAQETGAATRVIQQVSGTLSGKGVQAGALILKPNDPRFKKLVSALAVDGFPAVVLLGKTCAPSVVKGEITEDALLRDYVRVTCAVGCAPGACGTTAGASGCCPGK